MKRNEFVEYVTGDLLSSLDGITARAMFGGFGIYRNGIIFGVVVGDELYFKVDDANRAEYEAMKSAPFSYKTKGGKKMTMSYWKISPDIFENRDKLVRLAQMSCRVGAKAAFKKKKGGRKK